MVSSDDDFLGAAWLPPDERDIEMSEIYVIGMRMCSACGDAREETEFYRSKGQCKDCILRKRAGIVRQRACGLCGEKKGHILFPRHGRTCMQCLDLPEPAVLVCASPVPETADEGLVVCPVGWMRKLLQDSRVRAARLNRLRFRQDGYECDMDLEHCVGLWERQRGRCALTGLHMTCLARHEANRAARLQNASMDRIDSSLNYSKANTQLVCMAPNMMKSTFSMQELLRFARRMAVHLRGVPEE